ncbi:MAG: primosomal protein N' [Dehalococcoidia bacterium]|nr:primosomal protein N' [Dehalococcoidia bacterium]MSQ34537.1 primosomal protein N' [Dehalococcoidia bacterium]
MRSAEIAVDFPDSRSRTFTYLVPDGMPVDVGCLVNVPFGAQKLQGVVFSLGDVVPAEIATLRPIIRLLEDGPFLSPERLELARWLAGHYRTTLYAASALMLPPGAVVRQRTWLTRVEPPPSRLEDLRPGEQRAWGLAPESGRMRKDRLVRRLGTGGDATVDRLIKRGFFNAIPEMERAAAPKYEDRLVLAAPTDAAIVEAARLKDGRSARRGGLLELLVSDNPPLNRAALTRMFGAPAVKGVLETGFARIERTPVQRDPLFRHVFQQEFQPEPTPEQAGAISAIVQAINAAGKQGTPERFLLFGVTGSGKTEVYLRVVDACLKSGKRAIVLVPEIALTVQTLRRFASRFPGKIALQHSGLSDGQRYDQWQQIRRGGYQIILGSRSAIFAPVDNLGLVVMDEEHEWTYKQTDQSPRYHARAVAERLCDLTGAVLVCGSATPALETFRRSERGEFKLLRLPRRLAGGEIAGPAATARVEIVDMREELRAGHAEVLSRALIESLRSALATGGRAILFINRRGVASFVQCRSCGTVRKCRQCDTSLVYHRPGSRDAQGRLICHYCGYTIRSTLACPACGGDQMLRLGPGTQAVAEAVHSYFPKAGVVRWDSDSARTAMEHENILRRFESGNSRVLVGTQLVAKGLDIPEVTLVGVVSADIGLAIPDFRAAERTFQLLAQSAGRAGRGARVGKALFQTLQPEHYAVRAAVTEDYETFYKVEMALRAQYAYPPFTRLVRLLFSDPDPQQAEASAQKLADLLKHERSVSGDSRTDILGPTPVYPQHVRGRHRWQIVLRGPSPGDLLDRVTPGRGWAIDVDPASSG